MRKPSNFWTHRFILSATIATSYPRKVSSNFIRKAEAFWGSYAQLSSRVSSSGTTTTNMESFIGWRDCRYFGDSAVAKSGRVLAEEERAAKNVYIQKMEREKMEKLQSDVVGKAKDRVEADMSSFSFVKENAQVEARRS